MREFVSDPRGGGPLATVQYDAQLHMLKITGCSGLLIITHMDALHDLIHELRCVAAHLDTMRAPLAVAGTNQHEHHG